MYALLTKQSDGSFDLPVIWKGTKVRAVAHLFEDTLCEGLFRHPFTAADRAALGLFPVSPAPSQVGQLATTGADTFDGATVQETATYSPDPNYVAPDPVANMIKAIKEEAGRRISDVIPRWKIDRAMMGGKVLDPIDVETVAAIRAKSDVLEAMVSTMGADALMVFDPTDDTAWV